MEPSAERIGALRRALLVVTVLDGVDLVPDSAGVRLGLDADAELITWAELADAVPDREADGLRTPLALWLSQRSEARSHDLARGDLRVLALPVGSAVHPGPAWVRERVLGGALDLGFGIVGRFARAASVVPLWPDVAARAGLGGDAEACWRRERSRLETVGRIAVRRFTRELTRDPGRTPAGDRRAGAALLPVGGCDVLTLLADRGVRSALAAQDGSGLAAVSVPSRSRGWLEGAATDPAFTAAAWTATDPADRGLARPLLVTADEVAMARTGQPEGA